LTCERASEPTLAGLARRRVLLLFPHMVVAGGALNYMLKLVELLEAGGAVVGILTMQVDRSRYRGMLSDRVELIDLCGPLTSQLAYWVLFPLWQRRINQKIRQWRPDVLMPQVFPANWWAWLFKQKNAGPAVVWVCPEPSAFIHSRDWINALRPFWKRWFARLLNPLLTFADLRLCRQADRIIANSTFTAEAIARIYQRRADAIAYPAIDFRVFHAEGGTERLDALVTVAKLSRFKRVDFLLRVFAKVLQRYPRLVYHIVGRGEEEDMLRQLVANLGIADRVVFHRDMDNAQLAELHRSARLFLHGSVAEPFGMAPLEAIACGTPVIAHNSGGPTEFINTSCGRLIDSVSEDRWCEEITGFLSLLEREPGFFSGVAENARRFSWEKTLQPALRLVAEI